MTALFGVIPSWIYAAMIALLLSLLLGQQVRVSNAHARVDRTRVELADLRAQYAQAAKNAESAAREVETRRETDKQTEATNARHALQLAQAAADTADAAAIGLRKQLAIYIAAVRSASQNPDAAGRGSHHQSADPLDMLTELYGRSDLAAGAIASYADQLAIAGATCERLADGLYRPDK